MSPGRTVWCLVAGPLPAGNTTARIAAPTNVGSVKSPVAGAFTDPLPGPAQAVGESASCSLIAVAVGDAVAAGAPAEGAGHDVVEV